MTSGHVSQAIGDIGALVHRNILRYRRLPQVLALLVIQPLLMLLLFRYILGGESRLPDYTQYLMPGIFALAVVNGSATIGVSLAEDITSGLVDRVRVLPIARATFLGARAVTDIVKNAFIIPLVGVVGLLVGFELVTSALDVLLAAVLLLALGWMFAWISMAVALWTGSVEATQGATLLIAIVFSFGSSGFAQVSTMPSVLQPLVKANPVTHVDDAVRALTTAHGPVGHQVVSATLWIAAVLAIMMPLAISRYAHIAR